MIQAAELSAPSKPAPYYRRRIAELVAQGLASLRKPGQRDAESVRIERKATRLSWVFASRLSAMLDARIYYSAVNGTLAFRRQNPRPALNGKTYTPKLPADAEYVGRYSYPHSRREFLRDLIETMEGKR